MLSSNILKEKKSPFMIYADFESILVPEDNGKQNPNGSDPSKYQKHFAYSYGSKLACVDNKFSKPFKSCLGEGVFYNFISCMIEESKYCNDVMRKNFNKELVMPKKDFESSTKCWICDNDYIDNDVKVRGHCHITGNYTDSAHRDCNINIKVNHKIPVVLHNLKNYDSDLIMQDLGKFNIKMSFSINEKLSFIDSFHILSSSLDSLVKNVNKNYFKYLSKEFDNNVLDLVKQKGSFPDEYRDGSRLWQRSVITALTN